jgi:ATP-dependent DNA ligase
VVLGWTDPEGSRPFLGALLLGYYDPDGRLVYAGRVGTGINTAELQRLRRRVQPLATERMPFDLPPPRSTRFGSPLVLSRVHWVRPELVAEVKFLAWTETICFGRSCMKVCARISLRLKSGARHQIRSRDDLRTAGKPRPSCLSGNRKERSTFHPSDFIHLLLR